jgi:Flp pilus assembly protein TadB
LKIIDFNCDKCGQKIVDPSTDIYREYPYANCKFCGIILNKSDSLALGWGYMGHQHCAIHRPNEVNKLIATHEQCQLKEKADKRKRERRKESEEFFAAFENNGDNSGCTWICCLVFGYLFLLTNVWFLVILGLMLIAFGLYILYMLFRPG